MDSFADIINLDDLISSIDKGEFSLTENHRELNAAQWARVLESLTNDQRLSVWEHIDESLKSAILAELHEDTLQGLLSSLPHAEIEDTVCSSSHVEAVEILEALPEKAARKIIKKLSKETQFQVEFSLSYEEDQVGRYANQQVYTICNSENVIDVIDELKAAEGTLESNNLIVLDHEMKYLGEVSINELLNAEGASTIGDVMHSSELTLLDKQSLLESSNLVKDSNRNYLPVLQSDGRFIGVFSVQDALEVFQEFYEAQLAHMGQVSDEELFSPVIKSSQRRATWLGINLLTAFIASFVIGVFESVLIEVVALAVLMPIVASMGGIAGSQTLTLMIRGLATGQVSKSNLGILRNKEFTVSFINGLIWALLVGCVSYVWFENSLLSSILGVSIVINMLVASLSGVYIPIVLEKLGVDPAIAGSVILTTVTDVVGFLVFLGGATLIFLT